MSKTKPSPKRKAKVWPHTCFAQLDEQLAAYNTALEMSLYVDFQNNAAHTEPHFPTKKVDKKKRGGPKTVLFTYCPICGKKLR